MYVTTSISSNEVEAMTLQDTVELLLESIPSGGATISKHGEVLTSGIAVGLNPYFEHHIPYNQEHLHRMAIQKWLETIPKKYDIGMWRTPDGTIVLDIIKVFSRAGIVPATRLAKETGQLSIYLLDTNTTLWIEYDDYTEDSNIEGSPVRQSNRRTN